MDKFRRHFHTPLYANAYYLMANTAVNSLSGFIFWTVAARFYDSNNVGVASAIISSALFLATLSNLGLGIGLIRFLPEAGDGDRSLLDSSLTFVSVVSLAVALMFLVGLPFWSPALSFLHDHPGLMGVLILFIFLSALIGVIGQVFVALRKAQYAFYCSVITSVLKVPLPILFAFSENAIGILVSVTIAVAVSLGVAFFWFLPQLKSGYFPRPRFSRRNLSLLLPYSLGNHLATLLVQTPQFLLPMVVLNLLEPKSSAYTYVAWMIGSALFMVSGAISTSAFAEGSNAQMNAPNIARKAGIQILLLSIPAVCVMLILGYPILSFFGPEYADQGMPLLFVLLVSAFPVGVNNLYFAVKRVTKETGRIFILSTFIAGSTVGLSVVLIPLLGITGNGIAWLVSQCAVASFVVLSFFMRRTRKPDPYLTQYGESHGR